LLRLRSIISFLLFILPLRIYAQRHNYVFQHIAAKDGLAAGKVFTPFKIQKVIITWERKVAWRVQRDGELKNQQCRGLFCI
jgi:hypothetical protein